MTIILVKVVITRVYFILVEYNDNYSNVNSNYIQKNNSNIDFYNDNDKNSNNDNESNNKNDNNNALECRAE